MLYMEEGEVVNATATVDARRWRALPIGEALAHVPNAAEYGEICFHVAEDEQLAAMFGTQMLPEVPWPAELPRSNTQATLANLMATLFDGVLEIVDEGGVNYVVFQHGMPLRGYYADGPMSSDVTLQVRGLLDAAYRHGGTVRRWDVPPALAVQAPPALIAAYREFVATLVQRLADRGASGAFAVTEQARQMLIGQHPALDKFSLSVPNPRDPVVVTSALSHAIAAWMKEVLWHLHLPDGVTPEQLIADVARARRHQFQAAGLFEALPWTIPW
jgi:hypothetical protein